MKLIYAIAFAVFFLALRCRSPHSRPTCHCCRHCVPTTTTRTRLASVVLSAGEVLTIEAILARYGIIITGRTDDEVIALYLDDLDDTPVGSIQPRNEDAVPTDDDPSNEQLDTIASRIIIVDPPSEIGGEAADDITTTGPSAQSIPVAAEPVDDNRIE